MKGLNEQERVDVYAKLYFRKTYSIKELTDIATELYPDRDPGVISTHMGSDMVEDGTLVRVGRNKYVKGALPKVPTKRTLINTFDIKDSLDGYTDKELADELRARGYEVEARKVTNI